MADTPYDWTQDPCLKEFLDFLVANPFLLASYKTLVQGIVASLEAMIAAAELTIVQYSLMLDFETLLLAGYETLVKQVTDQLNIFPWDKFKDCVPVSNLIKQINKEVDPYNLPLIGNVKNMLYDHNRKKAFLEFIERTQKDRKKFKDQLLKTLDAL